MPLRDVVVIGASAGGIEPLKTIVSRLPEDLPASVFVVMHVPEEGPSMLPAILNRSGSVPAAHASGDERIRLGRIYVAPPGFHTILTPGRIRLERGGRENRHRPSADVLFRSAARAFGPRVIGVVLSGTLDDGAAGLQAIKKLGGTAVVQDPEEAVARGMPGNAIGAASVDFVLGAEEIGTSLVRLTSEPNDGPPDESSGAAATDGRLEFEVSVQLEPAEPLLPRTAPSGFTCPECHGTLYEFGDDGLTRFRCRVGHAYSSESLAASHEDAEERALWAAVRSLEEGASVARRLAATARQTIVIRRCTERADENDRHAGIIRKLLLDTVPTDL
jgi:two-component system, chemotaxis family, protein-glutamate methylesterase/glutaminase